jgi:arylformamidase
MNEVRCPPADQPVTMMRPRMPCSPAVGLSPMRRPIVNKPLGIAYGTGELPAMIASSRDYHAYRSQGHAPGDLIPIINTNHFTILDELRQPNSTLTRAVLAMAQY